MDWPPRSGSCGKRWWRMAPTVPAPRRPRPHGAVLRRRRATWLWNLTRERIMVHTPRHGVMMPTIWSPGTAPDSGAKRYGAVGVGARGSGSPHRLLGPSRQLLSFQRVGAELRPSRPPSRAVAGEARHVLENRDRPARHHVARRSSSAPAHRRLSSSVDPTCARSRGRARASFILGEEPCRRARRRAHRICSPRPAYCLRTAAAGGAGGWRRAPCR